MNNYKKITINDLRSLVDLKDWVRNNTNKFSGKDIGIQNMLIIINYLEGAVKTADIPNKSEWLRILNTLKERQENSNG